jgi:hypothetical protein
MTPDAWREFLQHFSQAVLRDPEIAADCPPEAVASGWLGYPGATEAQLAAAEARLGVALPPSYRSFLAVSNGWRHAGLQIYRLWSTEEIEWFAVRHQDWIDAYDDPTYPPVPDERYFVYGEEQDTIDFRHEYFRTTLEISEEGDAAIYLLNPQVVTADGEWEAWFFANWLPGAGRYRSFWEMMQAHCGLLLREVESRSPESS